MEKRLLVAISLSLFVLLGWSAIVSKRQPIDNKNVTEITAGERDLPEKALSAPVPSQTPAQAGSAQLVLDANNREFLFLEESASLRSVSYKKYQYSKLPLKYGFLVLSEPPVFKKTIFTPQEVVFEAVTENKRIVKHFFIDNSNYLLELEIQVTNTAQTPINYKMPLILGVMNFSNENHEARYQDVAIALKDKLLRLNGRKDIRHADPQFIALRNRYFCAIIEPYSKDSNSFIRKISAQESEIGIEIKESELLPGETIKQRFKIYLGPQETALISRINPAWAVVVNYGAFDLIGQFLVQTLDFIHKIARNWGLSIVILSLLIYIVFYPLTLKQLRSTRRMQELQPLVEELRKKLKDNPQKLNKEIMELYRVHKINPLSGCLPLLLQVPIFIPLYQVLMRSVALKGAPFLWIKDLSEPDRLFVLPSALPLLGNEINLLPLLMIVSMFLQQKTSMASMSSGSSEQQKIMLIVFPVMLGFIFYHMPAGFVLYWLINGILMFGSQLKAPKLK